MLLPGTYLSDLGSRTGMPPEPCMSRYGNLMSQGLQSGETVCVSVMCSGALIGSPEASAFWYTAVTGGGPMCGTFAISGVLSEVLCCPMRRTQMCLSSRWLVHTTLRTVSCSPLAGLFRSEGQGLSCMTDSNLEHGVDIQASYCLCHGLLVLIPELGEFP